MGVFIYNNFRFFILNSMRLKSEYINTLHYIKVLDRNIKVEDNPYLFNFYNTIGLDFIFEKGVDDTNNKKRNK